ncbi:hypothetical protein G4X40_01240 [Rhodococcus sp. D2-41]|uniref:Integral membrane protein n=1 Tax=Speluncibacter jeojiensis TaxID=2710754 RepID=A0A9X4RC12_9ACTN|nr:hypothetical protein [Rhodococcus sp. D2-41]MDG3008767.1 hypothetical protein [Rhodococcus sp. D2-41]MDG3013024.1 hypothetical protein [Corynebacteriales bacterium D3-21]
MPVQPDHDQHALLGPPRTFLAAGALVALEGAVAVVVAVVLVIRALTGHDQSTALGYGVAAWLVILGGAVLAAGVSMLRSGRWGRGVGVLAQLLLAPVAWSLLGESHQVAWGALLTIVVVPTFVMLVLPSSTAWSGRPRD